MYQETIRKAKTSSGVVCGIRGNNPVYTVFKGIPYAKPPVGELRWKAPQPVECWDGEYLAYEYQPVAMQPCRYDEPIYGREFFQNAEVCSEDCLYLNIWTPAKSTKDKLPVMFWIHGGGYFGGSGTEPEFDGEGFCRRGVILVTINYRLGALGFLAHPELSEESTSHTSGNYGLLDQIAALKWVRQNIEQFGGNPENITIFGQSAGAGSVQALISSPLTKGDIRRAIMQSGGGLRMSGMKMTTLKDALQDGVAFMQEKNCKNIEEMRALPADKLVTTMFTGIHFGPTVDGYVLEAEPTDVILSGKHHNIDYMVGNTSNEGTGPFKMDKETFMQQMQAQYGEKAETFFELCHAYDDDFKVSDVENMTENMRVANLAFAHTQLKQNRKPCYVYQFDRDIPGEDHLGAFHAGELWYLFQTLERCWRPFTGKDYDVSVAMADYWANFAKTGNPNGKDLPEWHTFTDEENAVMEIGEAIQNTVFTESPLQKFRREFAESRK